VVVPDQIRTILRTYRDVVFTDFFPPYFLPKTLIFAKDDSHAETSSTCAASLRQGQRLLQENHLPGQAPVTGKPAKSEELIRNSALRPRSALQ